MSSNMNCLCWMEYGAQQVSDCIEQSRGSGGGGGGRKPGKVMQHIFHISCFNYTGPERSGRRGWTYRISRKARGRRCAEKRSWTSWTFRETWTICWACEYFLSIERMHVERVIVIHHMCVKGLTHSHQLYFYKIGFSPTKSTQECCICFAHVSIAIQGPDERQSSESTWQTTDVPTY